MSLTPWTRQEEWYQQMINAATGKYLPSITPQDAGKVMTVESDGSWGVNDIPLQIETTYSDLKALRDAGKLVAGATYRMTDYVTKINGKYDLSHFGASGYIHYAKSAEHPFDLILYAIDGSHLSEIVKVAKHEGDTYFEHSAVEAWDVKYTIDNDANKYAWADATNGKGVIYYMKDEFNNEAGYDFKNVMFLAYGLKMLDDNAPADYFCRTTSGKRFGSTYGVFSALSDYMSSGEYVNPYAFSSHDFVAGANILGVIQFEDVNDTYLSTFDAEWYYTFDFELTDVGHFDYSLNTVEYPDIYVNCIENKIKICQDALASYLTSAEIPIGLCCTIFENDVDRLCSNNIVETNSFFNIFGGNNNGNVIGISAYSNAIGNDSDYNVIGDFSHDNFLASECRHNMIVANSRYVTIGVNCHDNTIESNADGVSFGYGCTNNTVYSDCVDIYLYDFCWSNTIMHNCSNITINSNCSYAYIGNRCYGLAVSTNDSGCIAHVLAGTRNNQTVGDPLPIIASQPNKETWFGMNSDGELKQWCPADLVQ